MSRAGPKLVVDEKVMEDALVTSKKQERLIQECKAILTDLQSDFEDDGD